MGLKRLRAELNSPDPVLISSCVHSLHRVPKCCANQSDARGESARAGKIKPCHKLLAQLVRLRRKFCTKAAKAPGASGSPKFSNRVNQLPIEWLLEGRFHPASACENANESFSISVDTLGVLALLMSQPLRDLQALHHHFRNALEQFIAEVMVCLAQIAEMLARQ